MSNKKILVTVSEEMYNQVAEVMGKLGHMSISETGRYGFSVLVKKELDNYVEVQKQRLQNKKKKIDVPKSAEIVNVQELICDALSGKIEGDICLYTVYQELPGNKIESTDRQIPLNELTEVMVEYQYETLSGRRGEEARIKIKAILRDQKNGRNSRCNDKWGNV